MKTQLLGQLEQKIMDVLWQANKPFKPAEVLKNLKGDYAYTTVMTVLKRMADKKIVKRKMEGKVYFYTPVLTKDQFIGTNLSGIYGNLVNSYGELAISQFVDTVKNNKEDIKLLKQFLEKNEKS